LRFRGDASIVSLLLWAGADPNYVQTKDPTWFGFTPLFIGLRFNVPVEVLRRLFDHGARRDVSLPDGSTPDDVAREYSSAEARSLVSSPPQLSLAMYSAMRLEMKIFFWDVWTEITNGIFFCLRRCKSSLRAGRGESASAARRR
jgi:hypothetical protein